MSGVAGRSGSRPIDMLTPARRRVLGALRRVYEAKQGLRGCTVREVMAAASLASMSTTDYHLRTLERLGHAERYRHPDEMHEWGSGAGSWRPTGYRSARFVPLLTDLARLPEPVAEPHEHEHDTRAQVP